MARVTIPANESLAGALAITKHHRRAQRGGRVNSLKVRQRAP
jgi:hypothetical protein